MVKFSKLIGFFIMVALCAALVSAATVTVATGGSSISNTTAGGTFTNLTGPLINESASMNIGNGTIVLNAPSGFEFDTSANVTVLVTRLSGAGGPTRNINNVGTGTSVAVTSITTSAITFTVTDTSVSSTPPAAVTNSLTWQNVKVRPTAGSPLASGNITLSGTSAIVGVASGSSLGALTEIAVDTTPPVITRLGSTPVNVETGSVYSDAGATASDDIDGNITGSIVTVNPVNTAVLGMYTVTYDVKDSSNNSATQVTRTVNVVDTTIPVITLTGSSPVDAEAGVAYVDAGATALDNYDGDLTGSISTSNPVNTGVLGQYIVTYDVSDSSANAAVQVTRTVNVVDTTSPVISLVGSDPIDVEVGSVYTDDGATASDSFEGDLTGSINTVNPVDTNTLGQYTVTYDVSDSSANAATQVTRTVNVVDTTAPVITVLGSDPIDVSFGSTYTDDGATALDNVDGDITGSISTVNPVDTNTLGQYTVTYDVTDSNSNAATQATRTVNVVDVSIPIITMLGSSPVDVAQNAAYVDDGATALDDVDGDITGSIAVGGTFTDTTTLGSYTVTYDVVDSSTNAAATVTRTVNVVDVTAPVITLTGSDPVDAEAAVPYVDDGATALDDTDGDITGSIITVNPVDVNTLGAYVVTYDVSDAASNAATQVTRTVNVVDTTSPVITLTGSDPVDVALGGSYSDDGATAVDSFEGDLTGDIDTVNPVDTNTLGTYVVTYDVSDGEGNDAVQVTRTVNVVDMDAPVITLTGSDPVDVEIGTAYVDAGATALDNVDGDLTASIVTVNPVDVNTVGTYMVTYDVSDAASNAATQVTRTVNVIADATVPVITLVGSNPVTVTQGNAYVDAGATANDNIDGDITESIVTVNPVDVNTVGVYTVTYDVSDSTGNDAVQVTRTVNVVAPAPSEGGSGGGGGGSGGGGSRLLYSTFTNTAPAPVSTAVTFPPVDSSANGVPVNQPPSETTANTISQAASTGNTPAISPQGITPQATGVFNLRNNKWPLIGIISSLLAAIGMWAYFRKK